MDMTGHKIVNIRRGNKKQGRDCYIYARLVDAENKTVISASLDYITERVAEMSRESYVDPVKKVFMTPQGC